MGRRRHTLGRMPYVAALLVSILLGLSIAPQTPVTHPGRHFAFSACLQLAAPLGAHFSSHLTDRGKEHWFGAKLTGIPSGVFCAHQFRRTGKSSSLPHYWPKDRPVRLDAGR